MAGYTGVITRQTTFELSTYLCWRLEQTGGGEAIRNERDKTGILHNKFPCLAFSDTVRGQLRIWETRAAAASGEMKWECPKLKVFNPKNQLVKLKDYSGSASEEFWEVFPVNHVPVKTALINPIKLKQLADTVGYASPLLETVCKDLREGADIGCVGDCRLPTWSKNSAGTYPFGEHVSDAIASWVKKGVVYGPVALEDIPADAKVNGLMCRPKPDGSVRVILNMSAPLGNSVNDGIDISEFPATMSSTLKWLAVLDKAGRGCKMMKIDWADAYKHVPVRAEDIHLQWFSWLGMGFAELCLIFGTSSSVGIYDRAAKVVLQLVFRLSKFPPELVCQHLDDVCAASAAGTADLELFESTYRKVAQQVGVQLAPTDNPEKAFEPCTEGVVLGVMYNTLNWTWSIPPDKLHRLIVQIEVAMECNHLKQSEVWSLCGRVLHYAPLVPCGRFNLDYIIAANSVSTDRHFPVEVSAKLKRQLGFWRTMLKVCAGWTSIPEPVVHFPPWTRECYTDAAGGSMEGVGRGAGAVSENWWAWVPWARKINCGVKAHDGKKLCRKLSALELVGPLIIVAAGSEWCRSKPVRVWVDNSGSVQIWKKGYSTRCQLCTTLVKAISTVAAGLGCKFTIEKIRRCSSPGAVMADALSKAEFNSFRRTALAARWSLGAEPARVPGPVLHWLANPVVDDDLGDKILRHLATNSAVLGYSC